MSDKMEKSLDKNKVLLIAGASGIVGHSLSQLATRGGWTVRTLGYGHGDRNDAPHRVAWVPAEIVAQKSSPANVQSAMEGIDAVVNLSGSSIGEGRLNRALKHKVMNSRLEATRALGIVAHCCTKPPSLWFQASAVGYYGDTGEQDVLETDKVGSLFLSLVCSKWENEADDAVARLPDTTRLVKGRIGLVLDKNAPAWQKMLLPIKLGVGGALGSGKQWFPWISAQDVARSILFLIENKDATGIFNLTAPNPVRQLDLTKKAAKFLHRPAVIHAPAFALKAILGETADELLLPSCKALPGRLLEAGFRFNHPDIMDIIPELCGP